MIENLSGKNLIFNRCEEESNLWKGIGNLFSPPRTCLLLLYQLLKVGGGGNDVHSIGAPRKHKTLRAPIESKNVVPEPRLVFGSRSLKVSSTEELRALPKIKKKSLPAGGQVYRHFL
jgi:hypothetical protein